MGMPAVSGEWTAEMVRALPEDGNRYEVVDGELLVTPAPALRHQYVARELLLRLRDYLEANPIGDVLYSPADIEFEPRTMVQPDVFVFPLAGGKLPREWREISELLLAIEVLSPSTARYDREVKRRLYQRASVPEYWIVDPDARRIERWRSNDEAPEVLRDSIIWHPPGAGDPLTIDLAALFARALD